jgi:regulator of ribosome biosynthesis
MKDVAARVAHSTASVGKFNAPVPGDDKVKMRGKRRQFDSVAPSDFDVERKRSQDVVAKLLRREKEGGVVDVNAAARKIQQEKEKANRVAKRKGGKGDDDDGKKKAPKGKRGVAKR